MTQITERLMLIAFGISIIGLFLPIFNPILNFIKQESSNQSIIDSDVHNLKMNIEYFNNHIEIKNYTGFFSYQGEISMIIGDSDEKSSILIIRFCNITKNELEYRTIDIPISFKIQISSLFVKQYHIFYQNNQYFLFFE